MWTSLIKGAIAFVALTFMMFVLRTVLDPLIDVGTGGAHSTDPVVTQIGGYFGALTIENLTVIAALAVAIYLLGRAAVERELTR